jgi:predicted ATPase
MILLRKVLEVQHTSLYLSFQLKQIQSPNDLKVAIFKTVHSGTCHHKLKINKRVISK